MTNDLPSGMPLVDALTTPYRSAIRGAIEQEQRKDMQLAIEQTGLYAERLRRELNKHPRSHSTNRSRTTSSRKRAGSRKGNGRAMRPSDWVTYGHPNNPFEHGKPPNHAAREVNIFSAQPKAPGAAMPARHH